MSRSNTGSGRIRAVTVAILLACTLGLPAVARADVVLQWNAIMLGVNTVAAQGPFGQARIGAIAQLAVFEAVNAILKDYDPYLGTISAPAEASASCWNGCSAQQGIPSLLQTRSCQT
jgi:hypothetical protein